MRMSSTLKPISECRVCHSDKLEPVFSLGVQSASDFVDAKSKTEIKCPLELVQCQECELLQLRHTVDRELLYRHYYYRSGTNELMRAALKDVVQSVLKRVAVKDGDVWVDIGSNDNTLLNLVPHNFVKIGFEPASNLAKENRPPIAPGPIITTDFFTLEGYEKANYWTQNKKVKVISAIAMFYDLIDPHKFVQDVKDILAEDGMFVIQQNYLGTMLANNAYDNISHEHLQYYSLKTLKHLLEQHGLEIVDVELNDVNGGSFRTYVQHKDQSLVDKTVRNLEKHEERTISMLEMLAFVRRIEDGKEKLIKFLEKCKSKGHSVYGYGASNRGNTILQYCGINGQLVKAIADRNPEKWGKRTVASDIPIVSEEVMRKAHPKYLLILPYFYLRSFMSREIDFLKNGGTFIIPLPSPKLIHFKNGRAQLELI